MTQATEALKPADYLTLPLALFTITDLTDALGIDRAAEVLGCNRRYIYTVRNSNALANARVAQLIDAAAQDEAACRQRLVIQRVKLQDRQRRNKLATLAAV
jgi:hypothetical protein